MARGQRRGGGPPGRVIQWPVVLRPRNLDAQSHGLAHPHDPRPITVPRSRRGPLAWGAFGFYHTCFDHNICSYVIFNKAFTQKTGAAKPDDKFQYELYLVDSNLNIDVDIIVVQSRNKTGYEDETMPDGRPDGLITTYCVGYIDCPEAVNTVSRRLSDAVSIHVRGVLYVGCPGSRACR